MDNFRLLGPLHHEPSWGGSCLLARQVIESDLPGSTPQRLSLFTRGKVTERRDPATEVRGPLHFQLLTVVLTASPRSSTGTRWSGAAAKLTEDPEKLQEAISTTSRAIAAPAVSHEPIVGVQLVPTHRLLHVSNDRHTRWILARPNHQARSPGRAFSVACLACLTGDVCWCPRSALRLEAVSGKRSRALGDESQAAPE